MFGSCVKEYVVVWYFGLFGNILEVIFLKTISNYSYDRLGSGEIFERNVELS